MKIARLIMACAFALVCAMAVLPARAATNVVAALPELADIAKQVGGNKVSVYTIAKPDHDYHMIEPRPSDVQRIARADLVVRVGMDLDMWLDSLLNAAGNGKVSRGGSGYVDASVGIPKLQVPKEQITGASGDIHVYGNPHYFYDPENGKIIARSILEGLKRVSPGNKAFFQSNYDQFVKEIDRRMAGWQNDLRPYRGRQVVIYHESAVYFLRRFGLKEFATLEVKPGIPPSASHIHNLIANMKEHNIKSLVVENVYPSNYRDLVVRETGAKYAVTPYSVGSLGTKSYLDLIDLWVARYKQALS